MKQLIRNEWISLTLLFLVSLFIWFGGPHLTLHNTWPLFEPEKRFGLIVVLFVGWLILDLIFSTPQKPRSTSTLPPSETLKKLNALQNRFLGAITFLKKTTITRAGEEINMAKLPWYLFMGSSQSGKTTLLTNSQVNFMLAKSQKGEGPSALAPSEQCDWWATRDWVLLDIPSSYITVKEKTFSKVLWNNLLVLIKQQKPHASLQGILLALPLPELLKQPNQKQALALVKELKTSIQDLREKFGAHLPFHFIITKCDLLPGFVEFFSEASSDELAHYWGVTIPPKQPHEKLTDLVMHRFNALIKRLNKQLLSRLHQERNPMTRPFIKDFPLQVERLKETLHHFLKSLEIPDLHLTGVFLTSAKQPNEATETTPIAYTASNTQSLALLQQPAYFPEKAYFIRQLLTQGLLYTHSHPGNSSRTASTLSPRVVYGISAGIILTVSLLLGRDFQQGARESYAIQHALADYQKNIHNPLLPGDRLAKTLPLLDALKNASDHSTQPLSRLSVFLTFYSNKSHNTATAVYQEALKKLIVPEIQHDMENYLKETRTKNPEQLYTALKAYLMLNDSDHFDETLIANTLMQLMSTSLTEDTAHRLSHHLALALKENASSFTLDNDVILQARKALANISTVDLANVILKSMNHNEVASTIDLGTGTLATPVFVDNEVSNQIPALFTANAFETAWNQDIPAAAEEASLGNWVIGNFTGNATSEDAIKQTERGLREAYLQNYIYLWESQLNNMQLVTPRNLTELNTILTQLTDHSALLTFLKTIQKNTAFKPILSKSTKLNHLNESLSKANDTNNLLYQDLLALKALHDNLERLVESSNSNASAFEVAKKRIQSTQEDSITLLHRVALQNDEPFRHWLDSLASTSWHLIMSSASAYIQAQWQTTIYSTYRTQIQNHFPFSTKATNEVNLSLLSSFLGQQGELARFVQSNLKPFLVTNGKEWQWRTKENEKLPLSEEVIAKLQQAEKIQRAFFPNGDNKLFVQFTLQPVALDEKIKTVTINLNGEQVAYHRSEAPTPRTIIWPGPNKMHATSINFISPDNKLQSSAIKGDWSWFRWVYRSTANVTSRKEIALNFTTNGHTAKYVLYTEGHLNPFLPANLEQFQLPEKLIG